MSVPNPTGADTAVRRGRSATPVHVRVPRTGARIYPAERVPDSPVRTVALVARTDGRTIVQAYRLAGDVWLRPIHRTRFTRGAIARMRDADVAEVVLRRGLRRVSIPLIWVPNTAA